MNEVVKKENKDEKLLFTVNNSLKNKYISKHLTADLGSLGDFMKINEEPALCETREDPLTVNNPQNSNNPTQVQQKQQKNMEEIEQEMSRVAMIQANPLNVLSNDKDPKNKEEAAEYLMQGLLTKTFGQSDIKALKADTLSQLNFDRSNQIRLQQIQSGNIYIFTFNIHINIIILSFLF